MHMMADKDYHPDTIAVICMQSMTESHRSYARTFATKKVKTWQDF